MIFQSAASQPTNNIFFESGMAKSDRLDAKDQFNEKCSLQAGAGVSNG
jgi:hypothetical protein